ncbi:MAG: hypothetical protein MI923_25055 [Phycisphaerales bacterium]|nr:hypothetical protein [Phycisphaerales bacterium]
MHGRKGLHYKTLVFGLGREGFGAVRRQCRRPNPRELSAWQVLRLNSCDRVLVVHIEGYIHRKVCAVGTWRLVIVISVVKVHVSFERVAVPAASGMLSA